MIFDPLNAGETLEQVVEDPQCLDKVSKSPLHPAMASTSSSVDYYLNCPFPLSAPSSEFELESIHAEKHPGHLLHSRVAIKLVLDNQVDFEAQISKVIIPPDRIHCLSLPLNTTSTLSSPSALRTLSEGLETAPVISGIESCRVVETVCSEDQPIPWCLTFHSGWPPDVLSHLLPTTTPETRDSKSRGVLAL